MVKKSRRTKEDQRSSDGGIAIETLSEGLAAEAAQESEEGQLLLVDLEIADRGVLQWVQIGQAVTLEQSGKRIAASYRTRHIGLVEQSADRQVRDIMERGRYRASIANVVDNGAVIALRW